MAFAEAMNGVSRRMGVGENPDAPNVDDAAPVPGPSSVETYEPDYNYPRVAPPLAPGEYPTHRRELERGETARSDAGRPARPVTPLHDERNLPLFDEPLRQLPIRDHVRSYPHFFVPYEEVGSSVWPDNPPRPFGYQAPQREADELSRAVEALAPEPWTTEDKMVTDISGLGQTDILSSLKSLFGSVESPEGRAAAEAVQKEAEQAEAEGQPQSVIDGILSFGSQLASLYVQKRQLDKMQDIERKRLEALRLQERAAQMNVGEDVRRDLARGTPIEGEVDRAFYESPWFLAGAAALVGGGIYLATRGGGSPKRRRR